MADLDDTLTGSRRHDQEIYRPALRELTDRYGLPWSLVDESHDMLKPDRVLGGGAEFMLEWIMQHMGESFPLNPSQCLEATHRYHALWELEQHIRSFDKALDTLEALRLSGVLLVVITLCPLWLAVRRLHHAGLLSSVHGVIGLQPVMLELPDDHPYKRCELASRAWLEQMRAEQEPLTRHLLFQAGVQPRYAKPHPLALRACMQWAGVNERNTFFVGDNPATDGAAAAAAGARYIHARYGYASETVPQEHPIHASLEQLVQLPSRLSQLMLAAG